MTVKNAMLSQLNVDDLPYESNLQAYKLNCEIFAYYCAAGV